MSLSLARQLARRVAGSRLPLRLTSASHVSLNPGARCLPVSRTYATKSKAKSTASFVPGSQVRFDSEETNAEYAKADTKMASAVDWYRKEVAGYETRASGRITPAILSPVRVKPYGGGGEVRLEEVATVGVKDGSLLIITVFDENNMKAVEQGIYDAKLLNVVPQKADSRTIRIPMPKPTVDARTALFTNASRVAEDIRCQIRKAHQAYTKKGKYEKHSIELQEFQKLEERHIAEVEKILAQLKKASGSK